MVRVRLAFIDGEATLHTAGLLVLAEKWGLDWGWFYTTETPTAMAYTYRDRWRPKLTK